MEKIKINQCLLTEKSPAFIVAEIGLNHNTDINLAKTMILKAKESGADAVKFQVYQTEKFIHPKYAKGQYDILKRYELSYDAVKQLKMFADKHKIIFFASPFDFASVDFLKHIHTPIIKIASSELSNIPFVRFIAQKKVPLFISTGLHTAKEIKNAIHQIEKINKQIVLFYCVSEYPLSYEHANLYALDWFKNNFDYLVGFSDHSEGYVLDQLAIALGVKVIEKHFTLDKNLPGPDHKMSLDVKQFKELVVNIRQTEKILGHKDKIMTDNEKKIRPLALKGLYAARQIKKGENIIWVDINFLRPELKAGIHKINKLLNKKSHKNYRLQDPL